MLEMKSLTQIRRDRARDRVLKYGKQLADRRAERAQVDGSLWPIDAQYLDAEIDRLSRRVEKAKIYLKESA